MTRSPLFLDHQHLMHKYFDEKTTPTSPGPALSRPAPPPNIRTCVTNHRLS